MYTPIEVMVHRNRSIYHCHLSWKSGGAVCPSRWLVTLFTCGSRGSALGREESPSSKQRQTYLCPCFWVDFPHTRHGGYDTVQVEAWQLEEGEGEVHVEAESTPQFVRAFSVFGA